jgi:hypothetical protein
MTRLGRVVVLGAIIEVGSWVLATLLRPGSWRYNISDLYSAGAPRPWLVMAGEAAFSLGLAVLVFGLHRSLTPGDHRMVGCALLALASIGVMAGAVARNSCEESVLRCEGRAFATAGDWVHGIGSLAEILGIAGAALVLTPTLPRRWATYSATTGCTALLAVFVWGDVSYPWVGIVERLFALLLVGWAAALGTRIASGPAAATGITVAAKTAPAERRELARRLSEPGSSQITESSRSLSWSCEPGIAVNTSRDWD